MDDLSKLSRGQSMEKIESELASFLDHTKQVQDVLVEPNVRLCCQGLFAPSACSSIPNSTVSQKCLV